MNIYSSSHLSRAGAQRGSEGDWNNGDIILYPSLLRPLSVTTKFLHSQFNTGDNSCKVLHCKASVLSEDPLSKPLLCSQSDFSPQTSI